MGDPDVDYEDWYSCLPCGNDYKSDDLDAALALRRRETAIERRFSRTFTPEERIIGANNQRTARMERALVAWAQRREGVPVPEIARNMGVGVSTVYRYISQRAAIMTELRGVRDHAAEILTCWNSHPPHSYEEVPIQETYAVPARVCAPAHARHPVPQWWCVLCSAGDDRRPVLHERDPALEQVSPCVPFLQVGLNLVRQGELPQHRVLAGLLRPCAERRTAAHEPWHSCLRCRRAVASPRTAT